MTSTSQAALRSTLSMNDVELVNRIGDFYADPLGFVLFAFPWGQPGTRLAATPDDPDPGPDEWQVKILTEIGENVRAGMNIADALPVLEAVASGHGVGKTALIAWIILWFIATREHPEIIVTAGKREQLEGKTWREVAKWNKLSLCGHWFHWTATKLSHVLYPETWFAHAIAWSKNAPENFAGTHERHVLMIFDEASAIDDTIWENADGAMTTAGAMWIAFGNWTRTTGRFAQCFGKFKHRWNNHNVDSRTAKKANKRLLKQWVDDYGEDSDFVRVRVRGLPPRAGDLQFITIDDYAASVRRELDEEAYAKSARILTVDVARHGVDQSCICKRQGRKVWPLKRMRITNLMKLVGVIAAEIDEFEPDVVFIDATGMGWGVVDRLRQLNYKHIIAVQTGEAALDDERFKNLRAELWYKMREFIRTHGGQLPDDRELESELTEPEYGFDDRNRWILESKEDMKERGLASPDGADALALSFNAPVAAAPRHRKKSWRDRLRAKYQQRSPMAA